MQVLMCRPSYFSVNYSINPWMNTTNINQALAFKEWHTLVKVYQELGIKVYIIEQERNLSDMVFSTDCGIVYRNIFIPANFTYPQRQLETYPYLMWFSNNNFHISFLNKKFKFEGGDCRFWNNSLFVGTGFRTAKEAPSEISRILNIKTYTLELINKNFYHLDTCLFILNKKNAFYYPNAFSSFSQNLLKNTIPNLIEVSKEDAENFATNGITYKKNIICQSGLTTIKKDFQNLGYNIIELDLGEFKKAGGGIHCLTKIIKNN